VERFIDYYTNNFWLGVKHDELSLAVLNEQVLAWMSRIRRKPIRELESSRAERFVKEKPCLIPLPAARYDYSKNVTVRVSRESLLLYQTNWYSVPPEFIGKDVVLAVDPFLPRAQVSLEGRFIRDIELAVNEKHKRMWREEDRKALFALWEKQQYKRAAANSRKPAGPDVSVRKPAEYEKLLSGRGAA
jgi:hypothetical protein